MHVRTHAHARMRVRTIYNHCDYQLPPLLRLLQLLQLTLQAPSLQLPLLLLPVLLLPLLLLLVVSKTASITPATINSITTAL